MFQSLQLIFIHYLIIKLANVSIQLTKGAQKRDLFTILSSFCFKVFLIFLGNQQQIDNPSYP